VELGRDQFLQHWERRLAVGKPTGAIAPRVREGGWQVHVRDGKSTQSVLHKYGSLPIPGKSSWLRMKTLCRDLEVVKPKLPRQAVRGDERGVGQ